MEISQCILHSKAFQKITDNLLEFVNNLNQVANCDSVLIDSSMTPASNSKKLAREENLIIKEGDEVFLVAKIPAS